jgi:hypothetical protein
VEAVPQGRACAALEIHGVLERYQGDQRAARRIVALPLRLDELLKSRDFR